MNGNIELKKLYFKQEHWRNFELDNLAFYGQKHMGFGIERIRTPLFPHVPQVTDIKQGFACDCIFLSLLSSAISIRHGEYFTEIMYSDDTYIFIHDKLDNTIYRMQKLLPRGRHFGAGLYSRSDSWVRFLEVFMHMRFQAGDERLKPATPLGIFHLLGIDVRDVGISQAFQAYGQVSIMELIKTSLRNDLPISVSYYPGKDVPHKAIYPNHAYGVLDIDEVHQKVIMFNPLAHGSQFGLFYFSKYKDKFELSFNETNKQFEFAFGKESAMIPEGYPLSDYAKYIRGHAERRSINRQNSEQFGPSGLSRPAHSAAAQREQRRQTPIPRNRSSISLSDWQVVADDDVVSRNDSFDSEWEEIRKDDLPRSKRHSSSDDDFEII